MIGQYYAILLDVAIGLAFAVGFKVAGGYLMKMMYGWFHEPEEGQTPAVHASRSAHAGRDLIGWAGLSVVWALGAGWQIRPELISFHAQEIAARLAPHGGSGMALSLVRTTAQVWASHAIAYNIVSILLQLSIATVIWLGRRHWVGKVGVWMSLLFALFVWVFGSGFAGSDSLPASSLAVIVVSILLLLPVSRLSAGQTSAWILRILWLGTGVYQILHGSPYAGLVDLVMAGLSWIPFLVKFTPWIGALWLVIGWWILQDFGWHTAAIGLPIGFAPSAIACVFILSMMPHSAEKSVVSAPDSQELSQ